MEMGNVEMGNGTGANPGASGIVGEDRAPVYAGRLEIRPADNAALVDGRPLTLTVRELQLLTELAQNAERVMTRDELYARVWHRAHRRPTVRSTSTWGGSDQARPRAAGPALHPHPHGDRLPLLPGWLKAGGIGSAIYIFFTSPPHLRNKISGGR